MKVKEIVIFVALILMVTLLTDVQGQENAQSSIPEKVSKTQPAGGAFKEIEQHVSNLQEKIEQATQELTEVAVSDHKKRLAKLEDFLVIVEKSLNGLGKGGKLFDALQQAIKNTEKAKETFKEKSSDPEKSSKTRNQYKQLMRKLDEEIEGLYDKKNLIDGQREDLRKTLKEWEENKEFIADCILVAQIESANNALTEVINGTKDLNKSIKDFASKMMKGITTPPESPTTPER